MQIQCPTCQQVIPVEQVDLQSGLAKCLSCNELFDFGNQVASRRERPDDYPHEQAEIPIPQDLNLQYDGGTMVLSWRWFNPVHIFMLFFCIAWDSFLLMWYGIGFSSRGGMPIVFFLFPLIHVAVGVGLTWSTLAGFFNRTVLRASNQALTVSHGPIPMPGQRSLKPAELSQLFCRERITRTRNGPSVNYEVCALLKTGQELKLVQLPRPEQARVIEQRIEGHLGIQNRPVPGEMA